MAYSQIPADKHFNMSYYTLETACSTFETGPVFPQIQKLKSGYNDKKPNSIYSYLKKSVDDFSEETPDLDGFIMHPRAKPTDFLSNSITKPGFFVSQKVKTIFENHNLIPHRFYPAIVTLKKKSISNYFWAHMIADFTGFIDYPNSCFFIYKHYHLDDGEINIDSLDDYFSKRSQLQIDNPNINITIWAKKIWLRPSFFSKELDLFKIGLFDSNFYISHKLRNALIDNNVTGCDIQLTDSLII